MRDERTPKDVCGEASIMKTMEVQIKGGLWNKRFISVQVYCAEQALFEPSETIAAFCAKLCSRLAQNATVVWNVTRLHPWHFRLFSTCVPGPFCWFRGLNMADKSTEEGTTIDDDEFCIPKPSWLIFDKLFGSVVQGWIVNGNYCRL